MIIPALLTDKKDKLLAMIKTCASFTDYIQIDIMDGDFVPSKSVGIEDLENLKLPLGCEAHLMVSEPLKWLEVFKKIGAEKVIYHFEIQNNHSAVICAIKKMDLRVGIAVNPATSIDEFQYLVNDVESILFMSVNPGFYGAKFIPEVLEKIKDFKNIYPTVKIGIDGGIKLNNVRAVKKSGVDYICVGSAIFATDNPQESYQQFLKATYD